MTVISYTYILSNCHCNRLGFFRNVYKSATIQGVPWDKSECWCTAWYAVLTHRIGVRYWCTVLVYRTEGVYRWTVPVYRTGTRYWGNALAHRLVPVNSFSTTKCVNKEWRRDWQSSYANISVFVCRTRLITRFLQGILTLQHKLATRNNNK